MRTALRQALQLHAGRSWDGRLPTPGFQQAPCSIALDRGVGLPTFTRATIKSFTDWEGIVRTVASGEACITGARRVQNLLTNTGLTGAVANTTAPTGWSRISAGGTFAPTASVLLPGHQRLDFTVNNNREMMALTVNIVAGHTYVLSAYCEAVSGAFTDSCLHMVGVTATLSASTPCLTSTVVAGKRMTTGSTYICTVSGTATFRIGLGTGSTETGSGSLSLSGPMMEDVIGQSNQNPSEYVSVGVLSAPYIQTIFGMQFCCNVDGTAYLPWQNGNTVASNVVTQGMGPGIGSSILLGYNPEEARTNLCLQSAAVDNAIWGKTASTIGVDVIASPDGGINADKFIPNNASAGNASRLNQSFTATASQPQTISFWAKAAGQTIFELTHQGAWAINETGTLTFTLSGAGSVASSGTKTGSIVAYPNGWYRCICTVTSTATPGTPGFQIQQAAANTGDGTVGFYLWGFQIEDSKSFATSYIPTTTVAVARNADVLTYPSAGNVLGATGTAYAEATWANTAVTSGPDILDSFPSAIQLNLGGSGTIGLYDGSSRAPGPTIGVTATTIQKLATKWDGGANSSNGCGNGTLGAATAWTTPTLGATMYLGNRQGGGTNVIGGTIKNVRIWARAQSDRKMVGMTR